jgi:two-component system, chemotaxis family, protein-glutamate methylesterase/glutaminase
VNQAPRVGVLIVDDSAVVRQVLGAILAQAPGLEVATAPDPLIAMAKMRVRRPDVIVLDLELPRMDGLAFLRKLMAEDPIPVVICSGHAGAGTEAALRAIEEGAVDVIGKPRVAVKGFLEESAVLIVDAVRAAARARVSSPGRLAAARPNAPTLPRCAAPHGPSHKLVAVGASTGGVEALRQILEHMPSDAPGIVVVQHMPEMFTAGFATRLAKTCRIDVKEAKTGDAIARGRALIAPGNRHTLVVKTDEGYAVTLRDGPLVSRHRPSVDVLFRSVAEAAGPGAVGVILTGMGDDGALGLLEMKRAGAATLAQDEKSCVVFGMPKSAIERGAVDEVVSLSRMTATMLRLAGARV